MTTARTDIPRMSREPAQAGAVSLDSSLLNAVLTADSVRAGAAAVLDALAPEFGDLTMALGARDRDSLVLHVLAEHGVPKQWPAMLEPQMAVGSEPGVDRRTGALVVPLRAEGRVVGALLLDDPQRGLVLLKLPAARQTLDMAAAVLHALLARLETELRHRLAAGRSVAAIADSMVHQIANPLTGASAMAQLLLEELESENQRTQLRSIHNEVARALTVLGDMLEFHRDSGVLDGVLDLNMLVGRVLRFRGYPIREAGITLTYSPLGTPAPVRADERLEHALLLAVRWAELRSTAAMNRAMDVRLLDEGAELAVEVTDSGPGDVPAIAPEYFDLPFVSGRPATAATRDVPDLGLVDRLLQASGGRLECRGSKFEGTTLVLRIPRAPAGRGASDR